jgi:multidrug efflux pump subunit AcrA (membrane-fusion protein)
MMAHTRTMKPRVARWVVLVVLTACGSTERPERRAGAPVAVAVTPAHEEAVARIYRTSGTVRGRSTVVVTSRVDGYVRAVHVRPGDPVALGQPLVDLEAKDVRAGVSRQRAELAHATEMRAEAVSAVESARVAAELARTSRDRVAKLLAAGAVTRQEADDAEARARGTAAQLEAAEARLRAAGSAIEASKAALAEGQATLDYARVTAPFAGRVVERRVDPGALASPSTPLLVLEDAASPRVEASVDESHAAEVRLGDRVIVELGTSPPVDGTISEIVPTVDVLSRAFLVKIDLPASVGAVQPGTFARVGFPSGTQPKLVVPTTAITSLGALDRVFVVEGGVARLRMITRGEVQGGWTEVLSGLSAGEQVVTTPVGVHDGARVEVRS